MKRFNLVLVVLLLTAFSCLLLAWWRASIAEVIKEENESWENARIGIQSGISLLRRGDWSPSVHRSPDYFPHAVFRDKFGRPLYSWRFQQSALLPAVHPDGNPVWSYSWNDPANKRLEERAYQIYCFSPTSRDDMTTNSLAITGPGTAFEDGRRYRIGDVNANVIMLIEVNNSGIHWMEPGDATPDWLREQLDAKPTGAKLGVTPRGFHVAFADSQVRALRRDIPFKVIEPFLYVDTAGEHDRWKELGPYFVEEK